MGFVTKFIVLVALGAVAVQLLQGEEDLDALWRGNRFTQGNFGPVDSEVTNAPVQMISGEIPEHLNRSSYLRTGPNPVVRTGYYHWFDGDGMIHKLDLEKMRYSSAYVKTSRYLQGDAAVGAIRIAELAAHPFRVFAQIIYRQLRSGEPMVPHSRGRGGLGNTALLWHNERLLAMTEGDLPYQVDPETLDTVGGGAVPLPTGMTAHPKVLPESGELRYFHWDIPTARMYYSVRDARGELVHQADFAGLYRTLLNHDFGVTQEYSVFADMPLEMNILGSSFLGRPFCELDASKKTRIVVTPRIYTDASAMEFFVDPVAIVHVINTFVDGHDVVFRACAHTELTLIGSRGNTDFVDDDPTSNRVREYRFNVRSGAYSEEDFPDAYGDFPVINPRYTGKRNRYTYLVWFIDNAMSGFQKLDHENGKVERRYFEDGGIGGEVVFIPGSADPDAPEDEGYLCTYVYMPKTNSSEWHLYSAKSGLDTVARVSIPHRIPFGFHGLWIQK